jgi:hypothetical protein
MLFFFRGHHGPAARIVVGATLFIVGLAVHAALFSGIGAVLIVWGGMAAVSAQRGRRHVGVRHDGHPS